MLSNAPIDIVSIILSYLATEEVVYGGIALICRHIQDLCRHPSYLGTFQHINLERGVSRQYLALPRLESVYVDPTLSPSAIQTALSEIALHSPALRRIEFGHGCHITANSLVKLFQGGVACPDANLFSNPL
uniref:F-box domain-containing protein n=1 Tax=Spongospora subterranea TaxID=70186 RepID=A0A0H5QFW4_9EUKA|eukprot:CRZ00825.1 hypothetical protein [Spongospora subterranea]